MRHLLNLTVPMSTNLTVSVCSVDESESLRLCSLPLSDSKITTPLIKSPVLVKTYLHPNVRMHAPNPLPRPDSHARQML